MSSRRLSVGLFLLPFLIGLPLLFSGQIFIYRDLLHEFIPYRFYAWELLRRGEFPFWTPMVFSGTPFFANLQSALLYPPQLAGLLFPFRLGFTLQVLFHIGIAALGMLSLGRRLHLTLAGALLASLAFAFGAPMIATIDSLTFFSSLAWTPLCLASLLSTLERPTTRHAAASALLLGLQFLAGEPLVVAMTLLALPFLRQGLRPPRRKRREEVRAWLFILASVVAMFVLVAFQAVPFLHELTLSTRAQPPTKFALTQWSVHPLEVLNLVWPGFTGSLATKWFGQKWLRGLYCGVIPFLLVFYAPWKERATRALAALVVFFTTIAMLAYVPGLATIFQHLPVFSQNRYPAKYFVMSLFGLALLAGMGLDTWRNASSARKRYLAFGLFIIGTLGLIYAGWESVVNKWFIHSFPHVTSSLLAQHWLVSSTLQLVALSLLGFGFILFLMLRMKWARYGVPIVIVLAFFELISYLPSFTLFGPYSFLASSAENDRFFIGMSAPRIFRYGPTPQDLVNIYQQESYAAVPFLLKESLGPSLGLRRGVAQAYGVQGLIPEKFMTWQTQLTVALRESWLEGGETKTRLLLTEGGVSHVTSFTSLKHTVLDLLTDKPGFLYAVAPRPLPCEWYSAEGGSMACNLSHPTPNRMRIELDSTTKTSAGKVIIRERFHSGWKAFVEGKEIPLTPAGRFEMGMELEILPGQNQIDLRYREYKWPWVAWLSLFALALCLCMASPAQGFPGIKK